MAQPRGTAIGNPMLWSSLLIGFLLGLIVGAFVLHCWRGNQGDAALRTLLNEHASDKQDHERRLSEKEVELGLRHERINTLGAEQEKVRSLGSKLAEQHVLHEEARMRMEKEFTLIADRLLGEKGKQLGEQQTKDLNALIKPLQDRISEFKKQVEDAYEKEGRERFAQNHLAIAERAGALYQKFASFTEDLGRIGKHVNDAKDSYEKALGNLLRPVEMLKELGAKTNRSLHPKLIERSLEEANVVEP
jgi:DNA anti-recombination protein RmuC